MIVADAEIASDLVHLPALPKNGDAEFDAALGQAALSSRSQHCGPSFAGEFTY